jgi:hypothetical protein
VAPDQVALLLGVEDAAADGDETAKGRDRSRPFGDGPSSGQRYPPTTAE